MFKHRLVVHRRRLVAASRQQRILLCLCLALLTCYMAWLFIELPTIARETPIDIVGEPANDNAGAIATG